MLSSSGFQINELSNVPVPVMLMPDDFKAYSKIKVDNHLFNNIGIGTDTEHLPKYLYSGKCSRCFPRYLDCQL
ncbi:hypothetical protein AB205_0207870 [Aquarana catesbeiana]|uniref:Uncharacterized protein n=1 Tax=Aquarana catesbeiana TaxID=8400 RepID=A0A2G9QR57_AQUCT|nr:hypothetical protein AB205_0207870 [Aquarana catesbeiana]